MDEALHSLLQGEEKVLKITTLHEACEGGREHCDWSKYYISFEKLEPGRFYEASGYSFKIAALDELCVTIEWEGTTLLCKFGEEAVKKTIRESRPYMSRFETTMFFHLLMIGPHERIEKKVCEIEWMYENRCLDAKNGATKEDERLVLEALDDHIARGHVEFYPMKALLTSIDDWERCDVTGKRKNFRNILKEGYQKDCLHGEHASFARRWLEKARARNDFYLIFDAEPYKSYYGRTDS